MNEEPNPDNVEHTKKKGRLKYKSHTNGTWGISKV